MTDELAMLAVANGDLDKSAILYERYKKPLLNFFLYHNTPADDARDLVQQVFVRLFKYSHSYKEGSSFRTWVYEISRNLLYDFFKKKQTSIDLENIPEIADVMAESDDEHRDIHKALAKLSEQHREVLILSRFENMSYEEIGQAMGLSVGNVKVRVFRAIQQLRTIYFAISEA